MTLTRADVLVRKLGRDMYAVIERRTEAVVGYAPSSQTVDIDAVLALVSAEVAHG